jgi:UDP-N-acetyl-2-amino-2-deoxyglucuronate dehydrogenase
MKRVVIVGCGAISQAHIRIWRRIASVEISAVCDANEKLASDTARIWKIPAYYTDASEMLSHERAAICDICAPPQVHTQLVLDALSHKYHVLVEKPIALSSKDVESIVAAQAVAGTKVGVIHNWLFDHAMQKALSIAQRGALGEVLGVNVAVLQTQHDPMLSTKEHWCHSLPGGRFGECLPHPIYIIQAFLNGLSLQSVIATKAGDYPWVPFDELHAVLKGKSGMGAIFYSFNAPSNNIFIDVFGTRKILRIDLMGQTVLNVERRHENPIFRGVENVRLASSLVDSTSRSAVLLFLRRWRSGHETYIRTFVDCVMRNLEPPITLRDASENVKLVEGILNMAASG